MSATHPLPPQTRPVSEAELTGLTFALINVLSDQYRLLATARILTTEQAARRLELLGAAIPPEAGLATARQFLHLLRLSLLQPGLPVADPTAPTAE